ncbi:MAG: hypothetical protein IPL28_18270 [Chloroflexi bacterium]|nr:hypothetical protein [Chloroflexota bacterium]
MGQCTADDGRFAKIGLICQIGLLFSRKGDLLGLNKGALGGRAPLLIA